MQQQQSKIFYYQPRLIRGINKAYWDDEGVYPHVPVLETALSMGAEEAIGYLSSDCRELIRSIAIHEDSLNGITAEIIIQESYCPDSNCKESRQHVLTLDEISSECGLEQIGSTTGIAKVAALELRQGHLLFDGHPEYHWQISAPSQILLTCPHCGAEYYADWPSEDMPGSSSSAVRYLEVASEGHCVSMRTVGDSGSVYTAVIDTRSGFTSLGNRTLFKRVAPPRSWENLRFEDCEDEAFSLFSSAFSNREIYDYVFGLLPKEARTLGLPGESGCDNPFVRIICSNRFRGYPPSFALHLSDHCSHLKGRYSGLSLLPVEYSGPAMNALYSMLALPSTKSLRRLIFQNPHKVRVLATLPELPFRDPNILYALISDENCDLYLEILSCLGEEEVGDIFFFLSHLFGDAATFNFLTRRLARDYNPYELAELSELRISVGCFDEEVIERLRRCRVADVFENAAALSQLSRVCTGGNCHALEPIVYTRSQRGLEASEGRFLFKLPENDAHLLSAGHEMKNCLGTFAGSICQNKTVVLVFDSERHAKKDIFAVVGLPQNPGRLAAAVLVDAEEGRVVEAHTPCNGSMPCEENNDLADAYRTWRTQCHLTEGAKSRHGEPF